jgi:hypothetical protein
MKTIKLCIAGVILSLLVIGYISHTQIRHVVQLTPLLIVVLFAKKPWAKYAANAVLFFWFLIMFLIWLFLLKLSSIANGTYSLTEIIMTITIGISCSIGIISSFYVKSTSKALTNTAAFIAFLLIQTAVMWISFQRFISNS